MDRAAGLTAGAAIPQVWAYGQAMAALGARVRRGLVIEGGQAVAAAEQISVN